jgi:hypothetical protein
MCMACEEMQLYYAYLDAVEEQKRKAQPWQCEVTLIAPDVEAGAAKPSKSAKPAKSKKSKAANAESPNLGFACDNPE